MDDIDTKRRFRRKVKEMPNGCWEWIAAKHPKGYGIFSIKGKTIYAHRYLWQLLNGSISSNFELDHLCNNKSCVRPDHLECTTHAENMKRAAKLGVWNGTKNGNAKRTEEQVQVIKMFAGFGIPIRILAENFKIPLRSVYAIVKRESWAHL